MEALRTSEAWAEYLRFMASFHRYSFNNLLLILSQRPDATQVAGYRAWQAKGRQVREGEKSIRIFGCGTVRVDRDDTSDDAERRRVFFPVSVFDIAQTDLMEGHSDSRGIVGPFEGADDAGVLALVSDYLTAQGVTVETRDHIGAADGYTIPANAARGLPVRVVIEGTNSPARQALTMLHEAAHITLGHIDKADEYRHHRGTMEVEAESVAYVLAAMVGLDSIEASSGYVAGWAQTADADVLKATAARVLAAVHTLATGLGLDAEQADTAE